MTQQEIQEEVKTLGAVIEVCDIHVQRIEASLEAMAHYFPLTPESVQTLSLNDLGLLELVTSRFAKLQDQIGNQLFPLFLEILDEGEDWQTYIDRLNRLEKIHILPSANGWREMRKIRNKVTHEYPDQPAATATALNKVARAARELVDYWATLKPKVLEISARVSA